MRNERVTSFGLTPFLTAREFGPGDDPWFDPVSSCNPRAVIAQDSGHHNKNKMAEGLITDCRLLLSRFENLKSVRFEKFCEVWREMNFSLIHWYVLIF